METERKLTKYNFTQKQKDDIIIRIYDFQSDISRLAELRLSLRILNEDATIEKRALESVQQIITERINHHLKESISFSPQSEPQLQRKTFGEFLPTLNDYFANYIKTHNLCFFEEQKEDIPIEGSDKVIHYSSPIISFRNLHYIPSGDDGYNLISPTTNTALIAVRHQNDRNHIQIHIRCNACNRWNNLINSIITPIYCTKDKEYGNQKPTCTRILVVERKLRLTTSHSIKDAIERVSWFE